MKRGFALGVAILGVLMGAGLARAAGLPSICRPSCGPLALPDGSTHVERGEGWVQRDPVVYLVFWGSSWSDEASGIVQAEEALFRELAGSSYNAVLGQFGVRNDVRLAGAFIDPQAPSGHRSLTRDDLAREARRVQQLERWRNGGYVQWVILPQLGTDMSGFRGECGEHDDLALGARTYYVDVIPPFQDPLYAACIYDYSADDGQRAPGDLVDATTSITSHEYAEAATDPWESTGGSYGWAATAGDYDAEVADLCAWYSQAPEGMSVNVTYLWSNAADGCVV